ncbi:MAG TPA: cyclopropane-fatty-acyl-phospholipid synthase family protein [Streptosporangiaceae bacterium]|jgi:cyclopropane-fatty-acyl-phospholipid synthase
MTRDTVAGRLGSAVTRLTGARPPVRLRGWDGSEAGPDGGPVLVVRSRRALRRLMWDPGELGLARAYIAGEIDVEGDLDAGLRTAWAWGRDGRMRRPRPAELAGLLGTAVRLGAVGPRPKPPGNEIRLGGGTHTRARDRAVISAHYDLSNDFYRLILDPRMVYSCGYWTGAAGETVADAQRAKLDLICGKLGLEPGMRLLDVGCGWGALILHAAQEHGVEAVGVTLSAAQAAHVRDRVAELGLGDRVEVRHQDYRDVADGPYDAVASVEMGEHVGLRDYPAFARSLHDRLRPGGRLLVQQMSHGAGAPDGGAFITSYIAADMHMRPVGDTLTLLEGAGLEIRGVQALREHYVRTVRAWRATLERRWSEAVALVGEPTARTWRLYLTGGALAFEQRRMGVDQILAVRPGPGAGA